MASAASDDVILVMKRLPGLIGPRAQHPMFRGFKDGDCRPLAGTTPICRCAPVLIPESASRPIWYMVARHAGPVHASIRNPAATQPAIRKPSCRLALIA